MYTVFLYKIKKDTVTSENNINKANIVRIFKTNARFKYSLSLEMSLRKMSIVFELNSVFWMDTKRNTNKRQAENRVTLHFSPRNSFIVTFIRCKLEKISELWFFLKKSSAFASSLISNCKTYCFAQDSCTRAKSILIFLITIIRDSRMITRGVSWILILA